MTQLYAAADFMTSEVKFFVYEHARAAFLAENESWYVFELG